MKRRSIVLILALLLAAGEGANAQARRIEAAEVRCPSVLGVGINTDLAFCDVLIQRDAGQGILVVLPSHRGDATISFNLHNRHTYSEEEARSGQAYAQYLASVVVATMAEEILAKGIVMSEFRSAFDLVDRVSGGAGPGGMKAIVPTGRERVFVTVAENIEQISIVGQGLEVLRSDSRDIFNSLGRPVAVISDVQVEYSPRR